MAEALFQEGTIEITESIARFGNTSYPVKNIGAVSVNEKKIGYRWAGILAIFFGLAALGFALWLAAILIIIGILFLFKKPDYEQTLILATSSGNQQAFTSRDKEQFTRIQRALEEAIAAKH